ncbi:sulfite exporter TauE/SafE family protein [Streptomyces sp. NBC_00091]|uniref:sulfite exporter TauE/SafE family protein n=1 Tax=Streptomyces sp. NBC_00091 TaxID=2975648 RepID=UPI0022509291|nr:sulfite exporter TauE/SafE family protein [Streptomyces sp. NBC_00091]MCX5380310.1 sulfite exporter TauE/SafE family protein [Streptomyces sp. NBC_00091]
MSALVLVVIGVLTGLTTVLFGFGGGFVTVPVIIWVDAAAGTAAATVAVATSSLVMVTGAVVATAATPRPVLRRLRGTAPLLLLLGAGGSCGAFAAAFAPAVLIHWGFVAYLTVTVVDVLARPGFLRPETAADAAAGHRSFAIPAALGMPIGAVASLLGVGGSVMTVPLLRRSGLPMGTAAALANPLTAAISAPACVVFLTTTHGTDTGTGVPAVGSVDLGAAGLLLLGALPVVVLLRRRPPRIADHLHAWGYVALLGLALTAMLVRTP